MTLYCPNLGEKELLQDILTSQAWRLGLYKAHIIPDGSTIFSTMEELDAEAGGYQTKDLSSSTVTDALTADKWYIYTNSSGKAEAQYDAEDISQDWTFIQADVDNADTAYGVMMWTLTIGFTSGGTEEVLIGDTITGLTGGATAIVTCVRLESGTWAGGDAAGTLCIKTQTGTFEAEGITRAVADCGTITGDSDKQLLLVESFTAGQDIDTVGQKIMYTPRITLSNG